GRSFGDGVPPVCSRRFSHDLLTRPSFMRDGKLFVYASLFFAGLLGRCVISAGTRASSASRPGVSSSLWHTRVTHHWRLFGEAQFVSYYPIRKCLFSGMNSFIGLNFNNAVKEREK
ncbi:hypothetical protein GOODEAATRI_009694, partial [Goodea atripinnis]